MAGLGSREARGTGTHVLGIRETQVVIKAELWGQVFTTVTHPKMPLSGYQCAVTLEEAVVI